MTSSNTSHSSFNSYTAGQVLTLNAQPQDHDASPTIMHTRVRQLHTQTLSCTMAVDILDENQTSTTSRTAFLKLFDRRFADQLRRDSGIEPWTEDMEQAYIQSVESGAIDLFLHGLHSIPNFQEDTEEDWDDAQNEAFLSDEARKLYEAEVAVYQALRAHQGRIIPHFLATVDLNLRPARCTLNGGFEPFKIKGILLEYISGFTLSDIVNRAPRSSWQEIMDQAVATVRVLGDYNILNRDVRPDNFMVTDHFQVLMIDFALCRFRGKDESDLEWGRAKHTRDEEGAIGLVMKKMLGRHGFELRYQDSLRYVEWADTDDSFCEGAIRKEIRPGVVSYSVPPK